MIGSFHLSRSLVGIELNSRPGYDLCEYNIREGRLSCTLLSVKARQEREWLKSYRAGSRRGAVAIRRPNQWSGVSPIKGWLWKDPRRRIQSRQHQIAPPLDPSPRWRFQRLARGTGSGLGDASYAELVKPSTDVPPTTFRTVEPKLFERILDQTLGEPKLTERPILVLPVSKYFASVYKICQAMVDSSSKPGDA